VGDTHTVILTQSGKNSKLQFGKNRVYFVGERFLSFFGSKETAQHSTVPLDKRLKTLYNNNKGVPLTISGSPP